MTLAVTAPLLPPAQINRTTSSAGHLFFRDLKMSDLSELTSVVEARTGVVALSLFS